MKIRFLGTGAADWPKAPVDTIGEGRRYASLVMNDTIIIDYNDTTPFAVKEFGVDLDKITDIVISHPHGDHFDFPSIEQLALARDPSLPAVQLWVDAKAASQSVPGASAGRLVVHPFLPWDSFDCHGTYFQSFPANHCLEGPEEGMLPSHFLITTPAGEKLIYLLDGCWLLQKSWDFLRRSQPMADYVLWEMTCGNITDWRIFGHCNLDMISIMRTCYLSAKVAKPDAIHLCSHIMRASGDQKLLTAQALEKNFIVAYDGMLFEH